MIFLPKITILLFLFFNSFPFPINEATPSQPGDNDMKCGSCPCRDSCGGQQLPQPSSPPPPSPPPPSPPLTYLSSQNCDQSPPPPPPSPRFIYVAGEPGNVPYQTPPYNWGNYYSAAQNTHVGLLVLAGLVTMVVCVISS